jgi:hypothetical protein
VWFVVAVESAPQTLVERYQTSVEGRAMLPAKEQPVLRLGEQSPNEKGAAETAPLATGKKTVYW